MLVTQLMLRLSLSQTYVMVGVKQRQQENSHVIPDRSIDTTVTIPTRQRVRSQWCRL